MLYEFAYCAHVHVREVHIALKHFIYYFVYEWHSYKHVLFIVNADISNPRQD